MNATRELEFDEEYGYAVDARREQEIHRLPKRYSARFEKQRAPQGARNGVHRRGGKSTPLCHAA